MSRVKFDFGIDLGTTNSAIACMDNGHIKIIKSHGYMKDTTPSQLQFTKKSLRIGDGAKPTKIGFFSEFKRTMGSEKVYDCEYMSHPYNSEELSAEVLKHLKAYVEDEDLQAAVITVPNQFNQSQIDATQRAAELAGFQCCELLQEPIAASMAYGLEIESMEGFWLVFDFGGGTFDTALMKVDDGIMKVVDTAGDNHLGGKDLDTAIIDSILLPQVRAEYDVDELLSGSEGWWLRSQLKLAAESIKISLSTKDKEEYFTDEPIGEDDEGEEIDLEFSLTLANYEKTVSPVFQKAIDIVKGLLERNNLNSIDLDSILLVGGPTYSQTLRRMLKEQLECKVDTSVDPMTAVALGAALFASTRSIPDSLQKRDDSKIQLKLKYPETTVETEENLGVLIDRERSKGEVPAQLYMDIVRSDKGWTSGKITIDDAEIIEVQLIKSKPNVFEIILTDALGNRLPSEPSHLTMIQGLKAAKATLPHSICIESVMANTGKQRLVAMIGLEKNNTLPAKGKGIFRTQKAIRPGNSADVLEIPIAEGEPGENAKHNYLAAVVKCSGSDLPALLPGGSEVELTLSIDESRRIKLNAYFPSIDESFETEAVANLASQQKEANAEELRQDIKKAQHTLLLVEHADTSALSEKLDILLGELDNADEDFDRKAKVLSQFKTLSKEMDQLEDGAEWPVAEDDLHEMLGSVRSANEHYGNEETTTMLRQFEGMAEEVCAQKNIKLANELTNNLSELHFTLIRQETGLWVGYVKSFDEDFHSQQWSDPIAARQLLNEAKHIIATHPSRDKLEHIVIELFGLLPNKEQSVTAAGNSDLLLK